MEADLLQQLSIVIALCTVGTTAIALVSLFVWMRINLEELKKVVYSENGEVRLVSFPAYERMANECRRTLTCEDSRVNEGVGKLEALLEKREAEFIAEIKMLRAEIAGLTKCVTMLSVGIKCE
jgi:hypothetical protein